MHAAALVAALLLVSGVAAQLRPVVIQGATVFTGEGPALTPADVSFSSGVISAVGSGVEAGLLARRIDGRGKFVTPGLIDLWSGAFARLEPSAGQTVAYARDAFDPYDADARRAAWRAGITTVYVPARASAGFGGYGAVIRLRPQSSLDDCVLSAEAALHAVLGSGSREGPLARVRAGVELRNALRAAREYRKTLEQYEEDLKEYEKKLAERSRNPASEAESSPPRSETRPAPARSVYEPAEEGPDSAAHASHAEEADAGEVPDMDADPDTLASGAAPDSDPWQVPPRRVPRRPTGPAPTPTQPNRPAAAAGEKSDELKKPVEPAKDRKSEALLRLMDGELFLRLEAEHPEDLATALEMAEEFHLPMILEGATAAPGLAERIARQDIPVILAPNPAALLFTSSAERYYREDAAGVLARAGVRVFVGSGTGGEGPLAGPRLAARAALAVRGGLDETAALERLTGEAARLLGLERKIGRLSKGLPADLVIWSDHPLAGTARVEMVFVDGQSVYTAPTRARGNQAPGDPAAGDLAEDE